MASEVIETREPAAPSSLEGDRGVDASARVWFGVLVVGLLAAAALLLWWGRKQWFFLDEWSFLVNRRLTDFPSMLMAHNGHWVTIPAVAYRMLFRVFGLRSYLPYQMLAVLLHLGVIVMMWLTMRRLQVRPAIATMTALPFVLYGAGRANILFGFQIALTGSIVFGLAHLLLATVDAPTLRRDVVGVVLGLAAIMCSAVGVPIVFGVALAVMIRRGWRAATLHAVPLAAIYVVWYAAYAAGEESNEYALGSETVSFAWRMGQAAFVGLGQNGLLALALALVAAVGIGRAVQGARANRHSAPPAIVAALIASSSAFALLTAFGRANGFGAITAASDRYIYVVAALWLPVVGLGAEVLARYRVVLGAIPLVLLALGLPDNIDLLRTTPPFTIGDRDQVSLVAHSPLLAQLPPDTRLFTTPFFPGLAPTAGFLRHAAADGRVPGLHRPSQQLLLNADASIALDQSGRRTSRACPTAKSTLSIHARRGTRIVFSGTAIVSARRGGQASFPATFASSNGDTIDVRAGPLDLTITGPLGRPPSICRIDSA